MKLTQYFPNFPKVVAHRGLSARAPENTLAAFEQAALNHLSWIECDLQLSLDGQVMIFHDEDLSRITGDKSKVRDRTSEELMSIDIGSWFSPSFCDQRILTLPQLLTHNRKLNLGLNLELKSTSDPDRLVCQVLKDLQSDADSCAKVLFSSFCPTTLQYLRRHQPSAAIALNIDSLDEFSTDLIESLSLVSIHHPATLDPNDIARLAKLPIDLMAFTVNDQHSFEMLQDFGVYGVFSDNGLLS